MYSILKFYGLVDAKFFTEFVEYCTLCYIKHNYILDIVKSNTKCIYV